MSKANKQTKQKIREEEKGNAKRRVNKTKCSRNYNIVINICLNEKTTTKTKAKTNKTTTKKIYRKKQTKKQ